MSRSRYGGKAAIVTGGASGIGRALGAALVARGAHVVLADLDGAGAKAAAEELVASAPPGGSVVGVALDVCDRGAVEALVGEVTARHGAIDLMVNNAGIALGGESHVMPPEHWDRTIDVNLGGVLNGVLAAYPRMVAQGHGHLVNTASMAGLAPTPLTVAYTMTKHAVVGLSTTLRPEAALHGVRVTVLCPGAIETPILDKGPPADLPGSPDGTLTSRQFLDMMRMRPMAADRFAIQAMRGIDRNRAIVIVPRTGRGLWYLQRTSPAAVRAVGRVLARRIVRALPPPT
jgi:NAD(P)-dependent dehydrogenase (short-subunit alcohol dehydrogenase family)